MKTPPSKEPEARRAYYQRNKARIREKNRELYRFRHRDLGLRRRYGITEAEYDCRYAALGGCCEICGLPKPVLDVDHDHDTGAVRGLLCRRCNLRVAFLEGELVKETMDYIQRHVE
jgi:hypothetical protein